MGLRQGRTARTAAGCGGSNRPASPAVRLATLCMCSFRVNPVLAFESIFSKRT
jgi:hypothetical protein